MPLTLGTWAALVRGTVRGVTPIADVIGRLDDVLLLAGSVTLAR
jgi:hypothetical protein